MVSRKIDLIKNETRDVKWLVDNMRKELLKVDNSFQRKYVWLKKHQVKLIETILLGYSIPEIYLWGIETNADTGDTIYSIVDGQQRIGAVLDFIDGKFKLSATYDKRGFQDLTQDEKKSIWDYPFSIRFIRSELERQDIVTMFLRLNSTNLSLNPQELRNAEFNGKFLELAEEISALPFWNKYKVFNEHQIRRMQDIQFISNVLIFFRQGIEGDTNQTNINKVYDMFNEVYKESKQDKKLFVQLIKEIEKIISISKAVKEFITKLTHLYIFITVSYYIIQKYDNIQVKHLSKIENFIKIYNDSSANNNLFNDELLEEIEEYKRLSSEGTQNKTKRIRRFKIVKNILESDN
ncbi:DUF262 domain-containing protein [Paenibacillus kandeliae]|uniref:DUF262 domain-containing protein n=1 Tax=Paenibacillus kandeliae TaxID=3231269 RepID=UPI003458BBC7